MCSIHRYVFHTQICVPYTDVFHTQICVPYTDMCSIHGYVFHTQICVPYTDVFHTRICDPYTVMCSIHKCVPYTDMCSIHKYVFHAQMCSIHIYVFHTRKCVPYTNNAKIVRHSGYERMKVYARMEVHLHIFLTSHFRGSWLASFTLRTILFPGKRLRYTLNGRSGHLGNQKNIPAGTNGTTTVQPHQIGVSGA